MRLMAMCMAVIVAIGYLLGGRLRNMSELKIEWAWLALVGLALQFVTGPGSTVPLVCLYLSFALLIVFTIKNIRVSGFPVILAGDIFDTTRFPVIDSAKGGSIQGEIAGLQKLVDTAIPSVPIVSREEGTLIIPGHGRICDQLDVVEYRDMVTIIRDRVRDQIKAGRSLAEVKAAQPAKGYMGRYGNPGGAWTTDRFIEAVYRSLAKEKS